MKRTIFHIDANSAFLSWTAAERVSKGIFPDIRSFASAVAGRKESRTSIILAKSEQAKKYGIKTGEPVFAALQKCPELELVPPDFKTYEMYSKKMFEICNRFSPAIQSFSIDELFLDYTNMEKHFGEPLVAAKKISNAIKSELNFTVNIGIGNNKLLAKMASDFEKPDKIHTLFYYEIKDKMWPLPVSDLFGVGRQTAAKLNKIGIKTIGELAHTNIGILKYHFGKTAEMLHNFANGTDFSKVNTIPDFPKSISNGTTVPYDIFSKEQISEILLMLSENTSSRLRKLNCTCSLITITLKSYDFKCISKQRTINSSICSTNDIYRLSMQTLDNMWDGTPIRAVTLALGMFSSANCRQYSFIDFESSEKNEIIDSTIDKIRNNYGYKSITRAILIDKPKLSDNKITGKF